MKIGCTKTVVFSSVLVLRFSFFRFHFKKFSMIQLSDRHCIDNTCIKLTLRLDVHSKFVKTPIIQNKYWIVKYESVHRFRYSNY